jgi:hypothetical protein
LGLLWSGALAIDANKREFLAEIRQESAAQIRQLQDDQQEDHPPFLQIN